MLCYDAFAFRQVASGPIQLGFVATSADIDRWAKVPTKMSRSPAAFQRPAIESHVAEVRTFFQDPSKANSSPTAIILGFEPESAARVRILKSKGGDPLKDEEITGTPRLCWVEIDFEPWSSTRFSNINDEIASLFDLVKSIYPAVGAEVEAPQVEAAVEDDEPEADGADDESEGEGDSDDDQTERDSGTELEPDEASDAGVVRSDGGKPKAKLSPEKAELLEIRSFFDQLTPDQLSSICANKKFESWSKRKKEFLRDLLKDDRKPGLIIDGQHRVKGTSQNGMIPFLVSFLPTATWAELAFQFIVNNGSSKKVGEGLLISIVGDSLAPDQLRTIEERLYRAKIKVSLIQAVMRVQEAPNPFSGMLEFGVPGEEGFLEAPAMQKKIVRLWYGSRDPSGNTGKFAKLTVKERNPLSMKDMFAGACQGANIKEKAKDWQDQRWFAFFNAFWTAVSAHFQPRLWPPTQVDWPSKAPSASAVEKERLKLMRVTVLGLLQEAVLIAWSTDVVRELKRKSKKLNMADYKITPEKFKEEIAGYIRQIPNDFFTEITYTGFDGSQSLRDDMRNQMLHLLEGRKEFADIRATHKFWK